MEEIKEGYTRVSSILQQWDTFGHIDKEVLARKAALGTRVHEAIDDHHEGIYTPLEYAEAGYFDSYCKWEEEVKPKIIHNEARYYCDKLMITGQVDAIIEMPGDKLPVLVDYKTSANESPKMWPLQACYYYYLAKENGVELSTRLIFLKLDRAGDFPKVCEYRYSKKLWEVCLSAWTTYRYFKFT